MLFLLLSTQMDMWLIMNGHHIGLMVQVDILRSVPTTLTIPKTAWGVAFVKF